MADEATPIETSATETPAANEAPAAPATETTAAPAEDTTALGEAGSEAGDEGADKGAEVEEAAAPEAYELTFSEGVTADPATVAEATPLLQELKLTNEQAQKFVPVIEAHTNRAIEAYKASVDTFIGEQRNGWLEAAKADPDIGGPRWDASIADAAKALDRFGATKGSEFRGLLDASGLGNHPAMIRMFAQIGKSISEDTSFPRGEGSAPAKSREELLYPSMTKKD